MGCSSSTENTGLMSENNFKLDKRERIPIENGERPNNYVYNPTIHRGNFDFNPNKHIHVIANQGHVNQEYELKEPPLGEGAFGKVMLGVHRSSGLKRAIKIIQKDRSNPDELQKIKDEVKMLILCIKFMRFVFFNFLFMIYLLSINTVYILN